MAALFGYGVGWAARRGAKYVRDQRTSAEWRSHPYPPIQPPLPPQSQVTRPDFTFGVPFGWDEQTSDQAASMAAMQSGGYTTAAVVLNFATDRVQCGIDVARLTGGFLTFEKDFYPVLQEMIAMLEGPTKAEHVQGPYFNSVGGEPAALWESRYLANSKQMGGPDSWFTSKSTLVVTAHRGVGYRIAFAGPEDDHRIWLPGFLTALGTWQWHQ
jgi:hypothetical protein